jgi:hypothetical protein
MTAWRKALGIVGQVNEGTCATASTQGPEGDSLPSWAATIAGPAGGLSVRSRAPRDSWPVPTWLVEARPDVALAFFRKAAEGLRVEMRQGLPWLVERPGHRAGRAAPYFGRA